MTSKRTTFSSVIALVVVALALTLGGPAQAGFPERSIELVCANKEGSRSARWCVMMAKLTGEALGKTVEVVLKSGGKGSEAASYLASRPADGHTWLQSKSNFAGYMNLAGFAADPEDFRLLLNVEKLVFVIGVPADGTIGSFDDLIDAMRKTPGEIAVAGNGIGSPHHVHLKRLFAAYGVDWQFKPVKGSRAAMEAAMQGEVAAAIAPPRHWKKNVEAGRAQMLLVLNEERVDRNELLGVPIPSDFGARYDLSHQLQGIFVLDQTSADAGAKIKQAFRAAMETETYKDYLAANAYAIPAFDDDDEANTRSFQALRQEVGDIQTRAKLTH